MRLAPLFLGLVASGCSINSAGTGGVEESFGDTGVPSSADSGAVLVEDSTATTPPDAAEPSDSVSPPTDTGVLVDSATPDTTPGIDTAPPPDTGPGCSEATCGSLPAGAKRVALVDRSVACPPGFKSTDLLEQRDGDPCTCSCSMSVTPTCPGSGEIKTWYSSGSGCGTSGLSIYAAGSGVCSDISGDPGLSAYFKGLPPASIGGACAASPKNEPSAITRQRRLCEPTTGCAGDMCKTPYVECIEGVACGGDFPNQRTVMSSVSVTCPACTCGLDRGDCGGSITFFDKNSCGGSTVTLAANDACVATDSSKSVSSFKYTPSGPTGARCTPSYTTAKGTPYPVLSRTLCCR